MKCVPPDHKLYLVPYSSGGRNIPRAVCSSMLCRVRSGEENLGKISWDQFTMLRTMYSSNDFASLSCEECLPFTVMQFHETN